MQAPSPVRQALGNREIRLAETAWLLGIAAEAAYLVALLVFAYRVGGVGLAGLAAMSRTLPGAIAAPFLAILADRMPRHRLLTLVHLCRGATLAALALIAAGNGSMVLLLIVAGVEGVVATLHRPSIMSLMPALARAPEELIATNVISGTAESLGTLAGPALGAGVVALAGPSAGFAVPALMFVAAAVAVGFVRPMAQPSAVPPAAHRRGWKRVLRGFEALRDHPTAGLLVGIGLTQTFVRGLMTVLLVAASAGPLGLGDNGIGILQAAIGLGGIAGAVAATTIIGRVRLSGAVRIGLVLWGMPILIIGLAPNAAVAITVLVALGIGNAVFDVGFFSLLQRNVPNSVRASVFGAFEGLISLTVGLGAILAPLLEAFLDVPGALIATGAILPLLVLVLGRMITRADTASVVPEREMSLLRGVPMFRPLPLTVIEQLALSATHAHFDAGSAVVVEGEAGDRFYIVISGAAEVVHGKAVLRAVGPGDSFGEIALLRDRVRTATVRAVSALDTLTLARADFVAAVTSNPHASGAADSLIEGHLQTSSPGS